MQRYSRGCASTVLCSQSSLRHNAQMIMDGSLLGRHVACGREKEEGEEEGRGSITDIMNGFVFGGWLGLHQTSFC